MICPACSSPDPEVFIRTGRDTIGDWTSRWLRCRACGETRCDVGGDDD